VCVCMCVSLYWCCALSDFCLVSRCAVAAFCNAAKSSPQFVVINANMSCGLRCVLFVADVPAGVAAGGSGLDVDVDATAADTYIYIFMHAQSMLMYICCK